MKFINTMRRLCTLLSIVLLSFASFAQPGINSPYSSSGIGEIGGMDHATAIGIGNSTITMLDSSILNFYNPASYNLMAKGQPIFSFGLSSRISNYQEGTISSSSSITSIQHFALGFSLSNHFGLTFGLKPYSRRGYDFIGGTTVGTDSIKYNYSGEGGINEVFLGFSSDLIKLKNTRLAVGGNLGYLYGETVNTRKSGIVGSSSILSGGVGIESIRIKSIHYEFGTYLSHQFNEWHQLTLSATLDPLQKLKAISESGLYYSSNVNNPNVYDTLNFLSRDGFVSMAPSTTIGLNYKWSFGATRNDDKNLNSELSFHGTYNTTDWLKYNSTFDSTGNNFNATSRITFGIQYSPETQVITNAVTSKFYHRMKYRAGFYLYTLPNVYNNTQVKDFGTTFGIGIPIVIQKSLSSINFGFAYGKRGTNDSQSLNETYYGINFGISIAPGSNEKWFRKTKLN